MRQTLSKTAAALVVIATMYTPAFADDQCASGVSSALDQQHQRYIAANASLAQQNFSKRPGTFAATTCLDNLMTSGGLDIFFKPPSLDNILNMVKNLACQQATQIFDSLLQGKGISASSLQPGEILSGVSLGGNLLSSMTSTTTTSSTGSVGALISSLLGSSTTTTTTTTTTIVDSSLRKVFQ